MIFSPFYGIYLPSKALKQTYLVSWASQRPGRKLFDLEPLALALLVVMNV